MKDKAFKKFKPFKLFKTIARVFDGLNVLNGLNGLNRRRPAFNGGAYCPPAVTQLFRRSARRSTMMPPSDMKYRLRSCSTS
jgi:hypothetical protein